MTTTRFTTDDLDLFQCASHDANPLHTSQEYARRSAYGSRVVYGVLNALMTLGKAGALDSRDGAISRIECEFFDVASVGVDYSVTAEQDSPSHKTVRASDGRRPVLEMVLTFGPGKETSLKQSSEEVSLRAHARDLQISDLQVGQRVTGTYAPCHSRLYSLCIRAGLNPAWATAPQTSALLWASYLIGMEMPGQRALFSRLCLDFRPGMPAATPFQYQAEIEGISDIGELSIRAQLSSAGHAWAAGTINAYVRQEVPVASTEKVESLVGRSEALLGKVALVTGASRGLGACLVRALALHGCTVVMNFLSSQEDAEQVRDSLAQTSGSVIFEKGDAASVTWCLELQRRIASTGKGLQFLICNASPPLLPLWLEPSSAVRVNDFLTKSLAMVTAPTAAFMPLIAEARGWHVLISSTAVIQIHPHFPHYTATKSAAEAIARSAVAEYRGVSGLIVRPGRLLTELTNTPLGRRGALPPETVASAIVRHLLAKANPGKTEILDDFSSVEGS